MMYENTGKLVRAKFREHLLPTVLMTMALSMASVVDGIIVGQLLGSEALAAIGLAIPIIYCINIIYVTFGVGGMMCASIARGRRENDKANSLFTVAYIGGTIVMLIFVLIMQIFMLPICGLLAGGDIDAAILTVNYVRPLVFTGPALMLSSGLALFMRVDGKPKSSAMVVIISNAVNLVLDYILIKFCNTGIMGAGLSTTLGYVVGVFIVLPYMLNFKKRRNFRFVIPRKLGESLKNVLTTGLPKGFTYIAAFGRSLVLNGIVMSTFGTVGISVMTVLTNSLTIAAIFVTGTSDTLLPIVGMLYGEKDISGIKNAIKSAAKVLVVACAAIVAFFMIAPQVMAILFGLNTKEGIELLKPALRMFALYIPFYAIVMTLQNFYNTTGRQKLASTIAVLDGFVFVCAFAFVLSQAVTDAFWLCYALGTASTLVFIIIRGIFVRRKENVKGLLLIREDYEEEKLWNMTISSTSQQAVGLSQSVMDFCKNNGVNNNAAVKMGIAIEEMAVAIAHYAHKDENGEIDVLIRVAGSDVFIRFRDNGIAFDPVEYTADEEDGIMTDGISVMKAVSKEVSYTRQLGFNTTVLCFDIEKGAAQ